ncbi:hypothetical protein A2960_03015 [Candidatus Gottesmanbacteria bacterium RIFCSPLOWO2_01_FULL_39_12b]|uniref:Uncharacterized protein n=1 Tax=Candidatus Gottesmanbacteria bacterium RIFCSPLOWO2_01_FULL_39_12b TaxID=1798388 RepID=A0A1F6AQW1_9BACT|nr:MAG: hypothetical protein A2960_03015 [Candidatus Gottesmanbacteria bacterium RIFCSPLOWO2_01_FULL_39_12b]
MSLLKKNLSRIILLIIICLMFISPGVLFRPIYAQTVTTGNTTASFLTPTPNPKCQGVSAPSNLLDFIKGLFNKGSELKEINTAGLPPKTLVTDNNASDPDCQPSQDESAVAGTSYQYNAAAAAQQTFTESSEVGSNFFSKFTDFFGFFNKGNERAIDYASSQLPSSSDIVKKELSRDFNTPAQSNLLSQADSNQVLGLSTGLEKAMQKALDIVKCANRPPELCDKNSAGSGSNTLPAPGAGYPVISPPPAGGGGYSRMGKCELGYGYCSVEYLKPFFDNDQIKAEKASQICWAESRGDREALNRGCFKDNIACRYRETSAGLFQINLWFDTRCPGALQNTVWGNREDCIVNGEHLPVSQCPSCKNLIWNPPISCEEGPNYSSCIASFSNPETNINFAVGLSKDSCGEIGTDWHDWSTASADNCDISQGGNCRR